MPKISVVTINYNNATGLQKTLTSVSQQTYRNYEHIVIDGSSHDGSYNIIKASSGGLSYWISEVDNGVYHAMNKGAANATGDYLLFLNSGDHLFDSTVFEKAVNEFDDVDIVYGNLNMVEGEKAYFAVYPNQLSFTHFVEGSLPHCGSFISRRLFEKLRGYDENLKICADWKFFLDATCRHHASYKHIDQSIATFYLDGLSSKPENAELIQREKQKVLAEDYSLFMPLYEAYRKACPVPVRRPPNLVRRIRNRVGF